MTKRKQERKIDGRTGPAKRSRALIAAYESQMGDALSPATRSLIARAVAIEISLEAIEADQIAGKPIDAEKHARLAGSLARLLDRLGLTIRPSVPRPSDQPRPISIDVIRKHAAMTAQTMADQHGWSDAERDRYAENSVLVTFGHITDKANSFSLRCADKSLLLPAVSKRGSGSVDASVEGRVRKQSGPAEKHARLAGSLARLLDRLGLTIRPSVPRPSDQPRPISIDVIRKHAAMTAQTMADQHGWSDAERDRYAENSVLVTFGHITDKANSFSLRCADKSLLLPAVFKRGSGSVDASVEGRVRKQSGRPRRTRANHPY